MAERKRRSRSETEIAREGYAFYAKEATRFAASTLRAVSEAIAWSNDADEQLAVSDDNPAAQAHLTIRGIVQGVFFRARMKECAERAGVAGWVRNRADGSVEALLHGPRSAQESVIAWARSGPPGAVVEMVEVDWQSVSGAPPRGFEIR
jgi:acylphosphatase